MSPSSQVVHSPISVRCSDEHNRTLVFEGLAVKHASNLPALRVTMGYLTAGASIHAALALDGLVIPHVVRACNSHDALLTALKLDIAYHSRPFSRQSLPEFREAGYTGSEEAPEMSGWLEALKRSALKQATGQT